MLSEVGVESLEKMRRKFEHIGNKTLLGRLGKIQFFEESMFNDKFIIGELAGDIFYISNCKVTRKENVIFQSKVGG